MALLPKRPFAVFQFLFVFCGCGLGMRRDLFRRQGAQYLPGSVITTRYAESELECSVYCTRLEACLSVNYKVSGADKGRCELNNDTVQGEKNGVSDVQFVYLSLLGRPPKKTAKPPNSCKDILAASTGAANGVYEISVDNTTVSVYCEMVLHGGGFTFIPRSAVRNGTLPSLAPQLFTDHKEVLLCIQKKDGSQTYTRIQQLGEKSHVPLVVFQNTYTLSAPEQSLAGKSIPGEPENSGMLDYLYLATSVNINGFLSNNVEVKYSFIGPYPTLSYLAFFPNHRREAATSYLIDFTEYETGGVAVNWRNTGLLADKKLPYYFFFLTEMHYGGGGCYTSSDRWIEANGTAIGLR